MDQNKTSWLSSNLSGNNLSHLNNYGEATNSIYIFTPAGDTRKHILCFFLSIFGVLGFLGNCVIFIFLGKKPKRNPIQSNHFVRNLNLYIRSLSLSDVLSSAVSVPLLCIQILYDLFQSGWPCKIVRYLQFIFTVITINTLVVISLEKYLTTRKVLRTVGTTKMRKMIIGAWVFGFLFMLLASAPYDGKRVDLNETHFTVICKNDEQFYHPFKITIIILPLQYVLPCVFVVYVNICLIKTVWDSGRRKVVNVAKNAFQAQLRAKKIRGITLIILLTFAFVVPFSFFLGNIAYMQIARPQLDFSTAYMARYGTGVVVFLSPLMNFVIYVVQMKDFREFLKKGFWRNSLTSSSSHGNNRHLSCHRKTERGDNVVDVKEISIHQT